MPRGMLLAAGRGTRLSPLTDYIPKPLLPVANRPVMAYGLRALRNTGITEVCSNVSYLGEKIMETFADGSAHGVRLHWSVESEPTGTAGGVKGMQRYLDSDTVVVIAGDAMLDFDLAPLLAQHHARGAFASLVTLAVDDPSQYGVVVTDADGRIVRFQEKPAPGTEISCQANTGIYFFDPGIFDLIPAGEFCDFALNVFPQILRRGLPFYALTAQGYWTDIGNPGDYLQANLDFLAGRIRVEGEGRLDGASFLAPGADVAVAELLGCVIGAKVTVPRGSLLVDTVIWPGVTLPAPVHLSSAVCTPWGNYAVREKSAQSLAAAQVA